MLRAPRCSIIIENVQIRTHQPLRSSIENVHIRKHLPLRHDVNDGHYFLQCVEIAIAPLIKWFPFNTLQNLIKTFWMTMAGLTHGLMSWADMWQCQSFILQEWVAHMHHHIEVIFSTQQHVHDVQCLGMASASSVTLHAWAWPRRPIIELECYWNVNPR